MAFYRMALEYILVYCTSVGLTALGEPSLAKMPQENPQLAGSLNGKEPMPVWIVFIFVFLAAAKWIVSFVVSLLDPPF